MFREKAQKGEREGQTPLLLPATWAMLSPQLKISVYFLCKLVWHRWSLVHSLACSIISWEPKLKDKHFWRKRINQSTACITSNSFRQKTQSTEIILLSCRCWKWCFYWIFVSRRGLVFSQRKVLSLISSLASAAYRHFKSKAMFVLKGPMVALAKGTWRSISSSTKWKTQLEVLG